MAIIQDTLSGTTQAILANGDKVLITILCNLPHEKMINQIGATAKKYSIPHEILLGIYLIETTCRPFWFRLIEYLALNVRILLWFVNRLPIPNYTIGKFQLGLSIILNWGGYKTDLHKKYLQQFSREHLAIIYKSLFWKNHLEVCCWRLSQIYEETKNLNNGRAIRYIGTRFNGDISYGLVLEQVVGLIKKQKRINPSAHIA